MRGKVGLAMVAVLLVGVVSSACTSGSKSGDSTGSGQRSSTSAGTTTTTPSRAASSTPKATPGPLSKFEGDPAVKAMRVFFAQSGRTINGGHYVDAKLRKLITPFLATQMKKLAGPDVGRYYPGPLPFQPTAVQHVNATNTTITGCLMSNGWAQDRKTHQPARPVQVVGAKVFMLKTHGRWLANAVPFVKSVSCQGVVVASPKW